MTITAIRTTINTAPIAATEERRRTYIIVENISRTVTSHSISYACIRALYILGSFQLYFDQFSCKWMHFVDEIAVPNLPK